MITAEILVMMVLLLVGRFLTPKMMYAESAGRKFGIGMCLFGIYTVISLLMFRYLCTFDGRAIGELTGCEVWNRVICAFLLVNFAVGFAACVFYLTRDKRMLSQKEKIQLKDL